MKYIRSDKFYTNLFLLSDSDDVNYLCSLKEMMKKKEQPPRHTYTHIRRKSLRKSFVCCQSALARHSMKHF